MADPRTRSLAQIWVGAATGLRVVPAIILGLFAGVMVDRLGGRIILLWERVWLLVLAVLTAVVVVSGVVTLWQIVVLSVVSSAVLAVGLPATQTLVLSYVPKESLQAGNSVNMLTNSMARALGPLSGGFLIAGFGLGSPFLALVGLYVLALFFTFRLPRSEPAVATKTSAVRQIADGLKYIKSNPVLLRVMILAFSVIFNATFVPIIPVYARDRFDVGETGFGVMLAAWAIGQSVSALWIASKRDWTRKTPPILGSTVMFVVGVSTFALSTNFPLTLFALAIVGAAIPIWASSTITLLQTQSDPAMIGRVMSVFSLSLQSMMFGWFLGAWIGTLIGNAQMILIGTAIYAAINVGLILTSPQLRKL
ncbi:MAG: MFS transporter [Chloroflexi bacterium]|nr:MFS transporter [Chloroflexota bacterium]